VNYIVHSEISVFQ